MRSRDADVDFVSRMFAPAIGIAEDPVTGDSHCVLAGDRVHLAGHAVLVMRGTIFW